MKIQLSVCDGEAGFGCSRQFDCNAVHANTLGHVCNLPGSKKPGLTGLFYRASLLAQYQTALA